MKIKHLVVGCGEVGKALMKVLNALGHDPNAGFICPNGTTCEYLHICIPYGEDFKRSVKTYESWFLPEYTIIHSTVPIGTSEDLNAHHSPIRGKHPDLAESIRTFVKYVAGVNATDICYELQRFGIDAKPCKYTRDTEAAKLLDLMQYANSILIEKEIHAFCETHDLDFDLVYGEFNKTYNRGYQSMGEPHLIRPILKHRTGPIGGHCVVQNMKHLSTPTAAKVIESQSEEVNTNAV